MRVVTVLMAGALIGLWIVSVAHLTGYMDVAFIGLDLPASTAELGDSMGMLNGLFSSLAVILALVTVLFQSKELRDSTRAQNEQARALGEQLLHQRQMAMSQLKQSSAIASQLEQQQISNRIVGLASRQKFLLSEMSRMDMILKDIYGDRTKEELFNNCNAKKKKYQKEAQEIDVQIKSILNLE